MHCKSVLPSIFVKFIADLEDEAQWEASFNRTRNSLIAAAQQAKREIAEGQATPMDYEQL